MNYTPTSTSKDGKLLEFTFEGWKEANEARAELAKIPGAIMILGRDGYDVTPGGVPVKFGGCFSCNQIPNGKAHLLVIVKK